MLNKKQKDEIEDYFQYKWENDKNSAVFTPEDIAMMDQTPDEIKCQIYSCFLYRRFLYKYRRFFSFQNTESKNKNSFYTWGLQHY